MGQSTWDADAIITGSHLHSSGHARFGNAPATAAAGSTHSNAAQLPNSTAAVYPVTGSDGTKGFIIHPADAVAGQMIWIGNQVSNQSLIVYPPSGGSINGAATNAGFTGSSGKGVIVYCLTANAAGTSSTWLAW